MLHRVVMGVVVVALSAAVVVGCAGTPAPNVQTSIVSFELDPREMPRGASVTVSWEATGVGSRPDAPSCSIARRVEGQEAEEPFEVACAGSLAEVVDPPPPATYVRYQLNVLKQPFDAGSPYLTAARTVTLEDVAVSISPASATLAVHQTQEFAAAVTGSVDGSVTWTTTCGSLAGSGGTVTYTAPATAGECTVTATSVVDEDAYASATVSVELVIDGTVVAEDSESPTPLLPGLSIPVGGSRVYEVMVPNARDLLFGEATGSDLEVWLLDAAGVPLAVSRSNELFEAPGVVASTPSSWAVAPSSISIAWECLGTCAAVAPVAPTYLLEVRNLAAAPRSFDLFAYTIAATDENDRGPASNDTRATATPFTDSAVGAIELIGDVDWFRYVGAADGELEFFVSDSRLDLRLRFDDGTELTGLEGDRIAPIGVGERVVVLSAADRAGPSSASRYALFVTPSGATAR